MLPTNLDWKDPTYNLAWGEWLRNVVGSPEYVTERSPRFIDHPEVLREVVEETEPYPTCPGAKSLLEDPDLAAGLKKYARETRAIFDKVWAEEDKTGFKLKGRECAHAGVHPEENTPPPARTYRGAA